MRIWEFMGGSSNVNVVCGRWDLLAAGLKETWPQAHMRV